MQQGAVWQGAAAKHPGNTLLGRHEQLLDDVDVLAAGRNVKRSVTLRTGMSPYSTPPKIPKPNPAASHQIPHDHVRLLPQNAYQLRYPPRIQPAPMLFFSWKMNPVLGRDAEMPVFHRLRPPRCCGGPAGRDAYLGEKTDLNNATGNTEPALSSPCQ